MAAVQCTRCMVERKGFRRELDSWRHRLIHFVGFESILVGIYGPMLLRDLNLFVDCEPDELDDWSAEASLSTCSFCNLPLDKLNDQVPAAASPLSSPSDYSPCQTSTISESSQSAHKFLQAVFHKKDVTLDCDSKIPFVAHELMKKMIHKFAEEYASKCLLRTTTKGVTRPSSPVPETSDAPLDLTVNRTDGVLDLSNRNSTSSATTSSNSNSSGSWLPSVTEEGGVLGQRGTTLHHRSALDTVLRSLCPPHQSLLYQILKLANQEKLLSFHRSVGQAEFHCCHCGVNPQVDVKPHSVFLNECNTHHYRFYCPSGDCNHQSRCSFPYHLGDSESFGSLHHHPFKDCNSESQQGSSSDCVQRCRTEKCPAPCSETLHCNSSQSHTAGCGNMLMPNVSSTLLSQSPLCTSSCRLCRSVFYKKHLSCSCSCCQPHICPTPVRTREEMDFGDGDSTCTVLNRERSPSPPRLSPIPQDISKKMDEKPPSLSYHTQGKEADLTGKNSQRSACHMAGVDASTDAELQYKTIGHNQAEQNLGGSSLQDIVRRVTRNLDTITADPTLVSTTALYVSEDQSSDASTSQPFHADAQLTEIITTVLHTGSASDYNLNELFNQHHNKEPKSPNTRSRRRQEIQVATATPADDACARRNALAMKRELAMFDLSYSQRMGPQAKKVRVKAKNMSVPTSVTPPDSDLIKEACRRETEARVELGKNLDLGVNEGTPCIVSVESDRDKAKEDVKAVMVTDELETEQEKREGITCFGKGELTISNVRHAPEMLNTCGKHVLKGDHAVQAQTVSMTPISTDCNEGCGWSQEEDILDQNYDTESTPDKGTHSPMNEGQKCKSHQSRRIRKSLRNIVPPQRLSSYITWHTPISHASSVETDITLAKLDSKTPPYPQEHKGNLTFEPTPKEPSEPMCKQSEGKCQSLQKNEAIEKRSSQKEIPEKETDSSDNSAYGRLRPSTRRLKALKMLKNTINVSNPPSPKIQYISPIKLMYVSQVKDNEGVKYSLKSAGSGSSLQTEEAFDPCVESSWAGTPQKHKSQSKENAVSPAKKSPSPAKAITSHESPTSSPAKSATCQSSPRSAASSPKGSARTSDGTPSKRLSETENQRSPRESVSLAETTPPKRRPGRPRKLGPQLEQKVKRPIGRPRKQKDSNAVSECKSLNGKGSKTDAEDDVTKNLKITVVYGRSRRNKRVVSESFDQLQTDFNNTCHTVDLKSDLGFSLHCSTRSPCIIKSSPEEFCFIRTAKEPPTQSVSSIKSQVPVESAPLRKPGRPAKIKISGISVTVTSASPRRRQIQINRETRISPKAKPPKKTLLLESEKEPCIGNSPLPIKSNSTEVVETNIRNTCELPNQTIPLRHSKRDRKPSIHLVHAVATSTFGSYKCSHALLRRSRKLLINKVSSERRQEDQQASAETQTLKRQPSRKERESITQDLSKVAKVSLDSIFSPRETVRWWAPSAKEKTMSQELARRIRVISDTWVTDSPDDQDKEVVHNSNLDTIGNSPVTRKSKKSSAVRALFDCSPNKPRSCSMQQICSWFMQTTETQSLAIVKKASSRNPFEIMHFPRSTNNKNVRHSPQAERLRKHIKKFPKTVPKSPLQHQLALLRLRKKKKVNQIRRRLFASRLEVGKHNRGVTRCRFSLSAQFRATLFRVRRRFFTLRERERWQSWKSKKKSKRKMASSNRPIANVLQLNHHKALHRSAKQLPDSLQESSPACSVDQTLKHADIHKEQKLSSKAWSPEKLKECRVFLRKINSPDNESTEEEGDSCTVTLDNGSPSTDFFEGNKKDLEGVAKAVRNGRKRSLNKRICSRKRSDCAPKSVPNGKQRGKHNQSEVASPETPQPPPAKVLRQSRMRGLTGPRWCDYVIGT
ncbi:uncharacterized protein lcorl isoform X1 [Poecilia formosa]|uniref:Ligand dependent nuclear receptor corepressor-like n=2 Tax=Poecilia formosa TaxID=48698 RepID=A0A087XS48_POEFO|nr:PREDICTED: ligand-dependent nuclear receptor corepressor-like protein isoform X1 [Poecilia formosa]